MARTEARLKCSIWKDDDYRSLTGWAQWLYEAILSQSDLSQCGVITWAPKRFAGLARDATPAIIKKARDELRSKRYIVVDDDTDELWVRTFARNDGILDSPNLIIAMSHDFGAIHSTIIRDGLVEGLGEGFLEGLPERFTKPLANGYMERLAKPFLEAMGRPRGGGSAPPRGHVPQAPSPTPQTPAEHGSSSTLELVGDPPVEEEDHHGQGPSPSNAVDQVAQLVAERRWAKLSDDRRPPEGIRRERWLETTAANLLADEGAAANIRTMLVGGAAVDAIVDLFEPPERPPAAPPSPYPAAGEQRPPTYDEVLVDGEWKLVEHRVGA